MQAPGQVAKKKFARMDTADTQGQDQPLDGRSAQVWEKFLSNAGERAQQLQLNAQLLLQARAGGSGGAAVASRGTGKKRTREAGSEQNGEHARLSHITAGAWLSSVAAVSGTA